jgi:anti-sigma regulatory factor (Ser/Thr protein kinase)
MPRSAPVVLDPVPTSPAAARRWLRARLDALGRPQLADVALLLVSEAVTNAVLHARTAIEVDVQPLGNGIRVEVRDGSPRPPSRRRHSEAATTGRGLALVASLADDWGWSQQPAGKVVWFELHQSRSSWPADDATTAVNTDAVLASPSR